MAEFMFNSVFSDMSYPFISNMTPVARLGQGPPMSILPRGLVLQKES